jgi:hypothetical protein
VGADDTTVYSGALTISSAFTGPSGGPKDMDIVVKLQTPFLYNPTNGNLLTDIRVFDPAGATALAYNEAFGESNDTGARVVGFNPSGSTADYSDTGVDAVKFIYDGSGVTVAPNYTEFTNSPDASATFAEVHRMQQVYQALQFPSGPILIKELRWRPSQTYGTNFSVTLSNVVIRLSSTTASASTLSTTFASNLGTDNTTVYSGPLTISSAFTGPSDGPKDMDIVVKLQTPFLYSPTNGNLLVDMEVFDPAGAAASAYTEAFGESDDTGARVVAFNPSASTADYSDTGVDTVKFIYDGLGVVVGPNYTAYSTTPDASATFAEVHRMQQVYQALQFPTGPILIKELRWRPSGTYGASFAVTLSNVVIHLSTTATSADSLSTTFASNVGADDTTVYSGPLSISSAFTGPSVGPKDMDIVIKLQTPFLYDPANGNLLTDIKVFDPAGAAASAYTEAFGEDDDTGARVVGFDPSGSTADFSDTGVDAVKFIYDKCSP